MTETLIYSVASPKLPMKLEGRNVVGAGGFDGGEEIAKMNCLPVNLNLGLEIPIPLVSNDATESGLGVSYRSLSVHHVLSMGHFSEVFFPAIKSIAVNVINIFTRKPHDKGMKRNFLMELSATLRDGCRSIHIESVYVVRTPFEATRNVGILIINDCRLALRKWDCNHNPILANLARH